MSAALIITPRVRPVSPASKDRPVVVDVLAQGGASNGKGRKLSRTEVFQQQQQAELQARMAHLMPPASGQQEAAAVWMPGTIKTYDSRSMSGVVVLGGAELPFSAAALLRHGPTTFSPGRSVEAHVTRQPDGRLSVGEVRLSVGERARRLAELERQANAAEERYILTLGRRPH